MPGIRHVLFDADGVIQDRPGGWIAATEPYVGDRAREFLRRAWTDERPMLHGEGDFLPALAALLNEFGVATPLEEFFLDVWGRIDVDDRSLRLVDALRERGIGVHLGTNQDRHRGEHMRTTLGYENVFDVHCYSYELGVAKLDPRFFELAAQRVGAAPSEILFVDDNVENVEGARSIGMPAVHWTLAQGHDVLLAQLGAYGFDRLERALA